MGLLSLLESPCSASTPKNQADGSPHGVQGPASQGGTHEDPERQVDCSWAQLGAALEGRQGQTGRGPPGAVGARREQWRQLGSTHWGGGGRWEERRR